MVVARNEGRWPAFADAKGIDAKYAEVRSQAEKELADTQAGPPDTERIAPDDTEMKNPGGEFQHPSSTVGTRHAKSGSKRHGK